MTNEKQVFLNLIKDYISGNLSLFDCSVDWNEVYEYAVSHQVDMIMYDRCKDMVSMEVRSRLDRRLALNLYAYAGRMSAISSLTSLFDERGLRYVFLKGMEISRFYPDPRHRSMGDVDILLNDDDRSIAHDILLEEGYTCSSHSFYEWVYEKNDFVIELHNSLIYEEAINTDECLSFFSTTWQKVEKDESHFKLNDSFHFLYLILHLRKHFMNEGVGFRQFIDIALVSKYNEKLDFKWIEERLRELNLLAFTRTVYTLLNTWFGTVSPIGMNDLDDDFILEATDIIFDNGVFGFDNEDNCNKLEQNELMKEGMPYGLRRFIFIIHKLFPSYTVMKGQIPFLDGRKYLLPAAWIVRIFKGITGRRSQWKDTYDRIMVSKEEVMERKRKFEKWGL